MTDTTDTILVIEDWPDDADLLKAVLREIGIGNPIQCISSAVEAIAYLQGDPPYANRVKHPMPGIIFLDLKLPGMDGFQFLEWLKVHRELNGFVVFAISSLDDTAAIRKAYALGATSFIAKPPYRADLFNLIQFYPRRWKFETGAAGRKSEAAMTSE